MHIDHDGLVLKTEGDVETKLLIPMLTSELYLGVPSGNLYSKEYLAPTTLDKGAKATGGYYPDFSIWMHGFPILIVEAKAPGASVEGGYREAALYAQHRNKSYQAGFNPCNYIIASNGERLLFGKWDSEPEFDVKREEVRVGGAIFEKISAEFAVRALELWAVECLGKVRQQRGVRPFNRAGGQALLNAKKPLNSFAAELSPILRRYFSSKSGDVKEIAEKAYVSSAEITEYDRVLEALLKDRAAIRKDTIVERLETERNHEPRITKALSNFAEERPTDGQLQIIQGGVGTGKSLFIRRYYEVLQVDALRKKSRWAWVDFNNGPADLSSAQVWLCESFIESFAEKNPDLDLSSVDVLKGIFSKQVQRRKGIYDDIAKWSPEQAAIVRNNDLMKWQDEPLEFTRGLGNYVMGVRHEEILIVVMDNVDRLDLTSQLDAFQLALWFMEQTKAFVILQMRDETYERYKNKPPLDTFRSGIAFHISPPRFIDVVKKRLDLSIEYLAAHAPAVQDYTLPSGVRIKLPKSDVGRFLHELYLELFERRRNISRILESLAGRDVRRALEMFVSIITSGHLREDQITSQVQGSGEIRITEHNILKILMRSEYRFFSETSGFITNIFAFQNDWKKPNNFIIPEILFYLANNRKKIGQIGIEGFFTLRHLRDEMQRIGIDPDDTSMAVNYLLHKMLIDADHMNNISVEIDDSVKISAAGYIHLRALTERIEYVYGVIPTTPITVEETASVLADVLERENRLGELSAASKVNAVETLYKYLRYQAGIIAKQTGREFDENEVSGTAYVLKEMKNGIDRFRNRNIGKQLEANLLD